MSKLRRILEGQALHAVALAILLAGAGLVAGIDAWHRGALWGIAALDWYWLAIGLAVAHQVYVWLCWRLELHAGMLRRALGRRAFPAYAIGFATLGVARVLAVFALAFANRDSLPLVAPLGASLRPLLALLAAIALLPSLYLFYSVKRYFSFRRALGIDHFDSRYAARPLVREGIFRYSRNGMYTYGFLLLWVPGLWLASAAALAAAAFNHLYIWVHYHATERPDMRRIYGSRA